MMPTRGRRPPCPRTRTRPPSRSRLVLAAHASPASAAAMSRRSCIPSKRITSAAAYAASRAAAGSRPSAVTFRTRPPAVTTSPSRSAVPAWVTSTPAGTSSSPEMTSPGGRRRRIAARGQHERHGAALVPLRLDAGQPTGLGRAQQQVEQVAAQPRQHRLRLGIAEAHVELEHLRPRGGQHQPGVEDAVERRAAARQLVDDRLVDRRADLARRAAAPTSATGENEPIPPVLGPVSPSPMRLKSRAGASGSARSPSHSASSGELAAVEELLDHHRLLAEAPLHQHVLERLACACASSGAITTPLPAASPSALITAG